MKTMFNKLLLAAAAGLICSGPAFSADKYVIDTAHSSVGFSIKHMGISNVKGSFGDFSGFIMVDEKDLAKCSVEVEIKAASVNTANEKRDTHLRGADFFDAEKLPTLTFKSRSVKKTRAGYEAAGTFTMHGVSKEIKIPFTIVKTIDPWKKARVGVEAALKLNRKDYGIQWNSVMDNGGLLLSDEVKVELEIEAVKE